MSLNFKCPACGSRQSAPAEMAGQKVRCAQCGQKISLAGSSASTSSGARPVRPAGPVSPDSHAQLAGSVIPTTWGAGRSEAADAARYACAVCGGQFDVADVYEQHGSVICKGCFAARQVPAVDSDVVACPSCGSSLSATEAQEVEGALVCPACAMNSAAQSHAPTILRRPAPRRQSGPLPWVIGGAVALAVLIGALMFARSRQKSETADNPASPPTDVAKLKPGSPAAAPIVSALPATAPSLVTEWERANLPKLAELRTQARALSDAGALTGASARYAEYFELAKNAENSSEMLQSQLADARREWDAVRAKLAPSQQMSRSTDSTAPAPPVAADSGKDWEQAHHARIEQLIHDAEARSAGKDQFQAALAYQQVIDAVGEHLSDIHDPGLKKKISAIVVARGKLLGQVKGSAQSISLTTTTLLGEGLASLQQNKFKPAVDSLSDVKDLVERNTRAPDRLKNAEYLRALHALAFAYLKTKLVPKAGELFDENAPLSRWMATNPGRELVINRCIADITQKTKSMRAAKTLKEYLEKHPQENDQEVLDLFGTSLSVAAAHTQEQSFLKKCAEYYEQRNEQLEKTRPGEKRWGVQWLPESQAQQHFEEQRKATEAWQKLVGQSKAAYADWQKKQQDYQPHGPQRTRYASLEQVNQAEGQYRALAATADAAAKQIPMPTWLVQFDPVLPEGVPQIAVAMVTPESPSPAVPDTPARQETTAADSQPPAPVEPEPAPQPVPVRRHRNTALAFAVDKLRLVTAAEPLAGVSQVRLEDSQGTVLSARVIARDGKLALLELSGGDVTGGALPYFNLASGFTGGPIKCACIPQANIFGPQPALLTGEAGAPPQQGDWATSLVDHPRLAGSPLLNSKNEVVGVAVPTREDPRTKLPSLTAAQLRAFLDANHALPAAPFPNTDPMAVFQVTAVVE